MPEGSLKTRAAHQSAWRRLPIPVKRDFETLDKRSGYYTIWSCGRSSRLVDAVHVFEGERSCLLGVSTVENWPGRMVQMIS
jgi:hypothetical protein